MPYEYTSDIANVLWILQYQTRTVYIDLRSYAVDNKIRPLQHAPYSTDHNINNIYVYMYICIYVYMYIDVDIYIPILTICHNG